MKFSSPVINPNTKSIGIKSLSRLSKTLYYHDYFMTNSNDITRTWEGINMFFNRKRKNDSSITALKRPGNRGLSHHTSELPIMLNNHFASVGPNLAAHKYSIIMRITISSH